MNSIKKIKKVDNLEFFTVSEESKKEVPFIDTMVSAGFPSPADDYMDNRLNLNDYVIKHPTSTYFVKVSGDSMIGAGIFSGDILGQIFTMLILTIAAAEAAIGLAIIVIFYRNKGSIRVEDIHEMKG